ncbi:unnamed protein product, partial [Pocillopora meandrina]
KTRVTESSDSDIKKLMASAVPESTKKSPKHAINVFEGEESHETVNHVETLFTQKPLRKVRGRKTIQSQLCESQFIPSFS